MFNPTRTERRPEVAPLFAPRTSRQLQPGTPRQPCLLLVCDSATGVARLRAALNLSAVEIVSVRHAEELSRVCGQEYTLAVIDVAPTKLVDVLKTIRASERQAGLPVFVEASGFIGEASLAGVLPKYRAMPCGYADLVALVRQRLAPTKRTPNHNKVF